MTSTNVSLDYRRKKELFSPSGGQYVCACLGYDQRGFTLVVMVGFSRKDPEVTWSYKFRLYLPGGCAQPKPANNWVPAPLMIGLAITVIFTPKPKPNTRVEIESNQCTAGHDYIAMMMMMMVMIVIGF
ncbi:hypothetical protein ElyMa_005871100 [Elysia marginata]|uniref:Uncharacterized protein n=1 Tax=Elysia marginata TaxID=1093978 RepID=A0AAV4G434_9GAST|nr:hypothetical protein ElyMa_005871100 [Elysia marginata]